MRIHDRSRTARTEQQGQNRYPDWNLLDWLKYILMAILIGLLLVVFVIQRNSVIGQSMVPNLA